jgi:hypothetical protein
MDLSADIRLGSGGYLFYPFHRWQRKIIYNIDTSGLYYKTFRIVIYDRNDTRHYYKTTIIDYNRS